MVARVGFGDADGGVGDDESRKKNLELKIIWSWR